MGSDRIFYFSVCCLNNGPGYSSQASWGVLRLNENYIFVHREFIIENMQSIFLELEDINI